jgi:hypothetical protein
MRITIDVKTLIVGIILGALIIMVAGSGVGSADADRFGISIEKDGYALIRTQDGGFYVVNPKTAMGSRVMSYNNISSTPDSNRTTNSYFLSIDSVSKPQTSR